MADTYQDFYHARHSQAAFVKRGYGQVEPNHLSAQHTGQIYAQLPAAKDITMLENGQFVKYDYAKGVCDFSGPGEWMLVFNEVKVYRDFLGDADFAMIADNYNARVYSPKHEEKDFQSRLLTGQTTEKDPYELFGTDDPFKTTISSSEPELMPEGTVMVPRVMKVNIGDIFTTNMIAEEITADELKAATKPVCVGPNDQGILSKTGHLDAMKLQVVKLYTMPDGQPGVKLMRIA